MYSKNNDKQTSKVDEKEIVYEGNYESSYATKVDLKSLYAYASDCFEARVIAIDIAKVNEAGVISTSIEVEIIQSKKGTLTGKVTIV